MIMSCRIFKIRHLVFSGVTPDSVQEEKNRGKIRPKYKLRSSHKFY